MTLRVGERIPPWELPSVSREKMKTMAALLDDSNPIHFDVSALRALGMGDRPVNQGPSNLAYVMNMLSDWAGGHDRVRRVRVRVMGNGRAGGDVTLPRTGRGAPTGGGRPLSRREFGVSVRGGGGGPSRGAPGGVAGPVGGRGAGEDGPAPGPGGGWRGSGPAGQAPRRRAAGRQPGSAPGSGRGPPPAGASSRTFRCVHDLRPARTPWVRRRASDSSSRPPM